MPSVAILEQLLVLLMLLLLLLVMLLLMLWMWVMLREDTVEQPVARYRARLRFNDGGQRQRLLLRRVSLHQLPRVYCNNKKIFGPLIYSFFFIFYYFVLCFKLGI